MRLRKGFTVVAFMLLGSACGNGAAKEASATGAHTPPQASDSSISHKIADTTTHYAALPLQTIDTGKKRHKGRTAFRKNIKLLSKQLKHPK